MSAKFQISKADDETGTWVLDYPDGYDDEQTGFLCDTFAEAIREFIHASYRWCPMCGKGAVVDRPWGWECTACKSYDVAQGCTR